MDVQEQLSYHFRQVVASLQTEADVIVGYLINNFEITPVVVGGLAVQHFGYVRLTEDIDILISAVDYQKLVDEDRITFGRLKTKPGLQVDVLVEGVDGNPHPDFIRDGGSSYPTLPGIIYLKLISGRSKDSADVVELIKINMQDSTLHDTVVNFLPVELHETFESLWNTAVKENKWHSQLK